MSDEPANDPARARPPQSDRGLRGLPTALLTGLPTALLAALRARLRPPAPEISPITGLPLGHLDGGLASGRKGFASAMGLHGAILALIVFGFFAVEEAAEDSPFDLPGLVFVVEAGPGGGGGGGGDESEEEEAAPLQVEGEDAALAAVQAAPDPEELVFDDPDEPNLEEEETAEDALDAPFDTTAPDPEMLAGLIRDASALFDTAGSGSGGGGGTGSGGGVGEGDGDGLGEGTGGGFGGGAYRIGSGVDPPQLQRRITPEYTDDALARKIEGKVILEVVILKNGRVGPARVVRSLDAGLDGKAIAAVRQWTFVPGMFRGEPVDVLAEIEVEFRLL